MLKISYTGRKKNKESAREQENVRYLGEHTSDVHSTRARALPRHTRVCSNCAFNSWLAHTNNIYTDSATPTNNKTTNKMELNSYTSIYINMKIKKGKLLQKK